MLDNTLSRWNLISKYVMVKAREKREKEKRRRAESEKVEETKKRRRFLQRKISKLKL